MYCTGQISINSSQSSHISQVFLVWKKKKKKKKKPRTVNEMRRAMKCLNQQKSKNQETRRPKKKTFSLTPNPTKPHRITSWDWDPSPWRPAHILLLFILLLLFLLLVTQRESRKRTRDFFVFFVFFLEFLLTLRWRRAEGSLG